MCQTFEYILFYYLYMCFKTTIIAGWNVNSVAPDQMPLNARLTWVYTFSSSLPVHCPNTLGKYGKHVLYYKSCNLWRPQEKPQEPDINHEQLLLTELNNINYNFLGYIYISNRFPSKLSFMFCLLSCDPLPFCGTNL